MLAVILSHMRKYFYPKNPAYYEKSLRFERSPDHFLANYIERHKSMKIFIFTLFLKIELNFNDFEVWRGYQNYVRNYSMERITTIMILISEMFLADFRKFTFVHHAAKPQKMPSNHLYLMNVKEKIKIQKEYKYNAGYTAFNPYCI